MRERVGLALGLLGEVAGGETTLEFCVWAMGVGGGTGGREAAGVSEAARGGNGPAHVKETDEAGRGDETIS